MAYYWIWYLTLYRLPRRRVCRCPYCSQTVPLIYFMILFVFLIYCIYSLAASHLSIQSITKYSLAVFNLVWPNWVLCIVVYFNGFTGLPRFPVLYCDQWLCLAIWSIFIHFICCSPNLVNYNKDRYYCTMILHSVFVIHLTAWLGKPYMVLFMEFPLTQPN